LEKFVMKNVKLMNARWQVAIASAALAAAVAGQAQAQEADATLTADADTTIKELSSVSNFGGESAVRTQGLPRERTLVRFEQANLLAAVGSRPVIAALLELPVQNVSWIWGNISAHRVSKTWTETGATWSCANDTTPGNLLNNCTTANRWSMSAGAGYASAASDTQQVSRNMTVAKFDVTADVQAFLAGTQANNGWLLKVAIEGVPGSVRFSSRESGVAPRLVLDLGGPAPVPGQVGDPCTADAECGGYANAVCFDEGLFGIPGGMCSAWCQDNSECPVDAACVQGACAVPCDNGTCDAGLYCADYGAGAQACLAFCTTDAECSDGRVCAPSGLCEAPEQI
jgi:hypothetical protein